MRLSILTETIKEILSEYNPAYEKHRRNQEMMKKLHRDKWGRGTEETKEKSSTQADPKKVKLFHEVVAYLKQHMNLNDQRKKVIWSKILEMSSDTEYWMKSYMQMGERGWHDVKEFILPGFQE